MLAKIKRFIKRFGFISLIVFIFLIAPPLLLSSSRFHTSKKQREVTLWHCWGSTGKVLFDNIGHDFNKLHPEIKLNVVQIGGSPEDIEDKLLTAITGKIPPDIALLSRLIIPQFAEREGLQSIDAFVVGDGINPGDFFPTCWNDGVYRDKVYALSFNADVRALYYNRTLFRKAGLDPDHPPRTWQELLLYADKLTVP